jgi:DNA-binding XRE family transcriptional regulator
MPTTHKRARRRVTRSASSDLAYSYVVVNDQIRYVLVPIEEYERLTDTIWVEQAIKKLEDPKTKWIDFDDWKLQYAGEQIAAARKAAGLTQKQLAAKLKMPQSQISRIERNPDHTTVRTLKRIAKALRVDVSALIN